MTGVTLEQDIPDSINIIVIADMHTALSENEMRHLQNYIARGGNLFIAGEPTRQEAMNPIVEQFGVQFMPGRLVRKSEHYDPDMIFSLPRPAAWNYLILSVTCFGGLSRCLPVWGWIILWPKRKDSM